MFSKAPRFVQEKPSETPGPNYYTLPETEGWDSYKRGAFLEKADRFPKQRQYEGPDDAPSTSEPTNTAKDASRGGKRPESAAGSSALRQQIEALEAEKVHLESQLQASHRTQSDLRRDLDRALEKEKANKSKIERLEAANKEPQDRAAKLNSLRKELDDLQRLHEDGRKAHKTEVQQLKIELERHRKTSQDQQAALRKQLETSEAKAQECKSSLLAAQAEITDLRVKSRAQEKQKQPQPELEQMKKNLVATQALCREREGKIQELEKMLQAETKKVTQLDGKSVETEKKIKALTVDVEKFRGLASDTEKANAQLRTDLEQARGQLSGSDANYKSQLDQAKRETEEVRSMLNICTRLYGHLVDNTVSLSRFETERLNRLEAQSRILKLERRLHDRDVQNQEFISLLRSQAEQQRTLAQLLLELEQESIFLRDCIQDSAHPDRLSQPSAGVPFSEDRGGEIEAYRTQLEFAEVMDSYQRDWLERLFQDLKATGHVATSLQGALTKVLDTAAELDGQLEVVKVEADVAKRRARELDEQVGTLQEQVTTAHSQHQDQVQRFSKEKEDLAHEISDVQRKLEEARKRIERLDLTVREKTSAEQALADEIENLTDSLQDAMRYEHAYKALCQEVDALVLRNELVEREADHLSRFNAEILGHANPNQKIHYLDRIRKDLAEAKHKLAISTKQRDAVLEDNDTLRNELYAYRSVSDSKPRAAPSMTRVARLPLSASTMNSSPQTDNPGYDAPRSSNGPMTLDELR
ncbi:hypothetical protein PIIN_04457 [Serendipita indica DSM 11827]|uniref:Hyaluronan-mediated motility receptor C-terminal domain-containing protein n=1 Tax=Serendipita indica (strain DSM 11827) TaxID=1109443 RepID=G4TGT4_SERID|nr:hypothetical protein PIIN_04457 [Serendipita indica DSM 11827]